MKAHWCLEQSVDDEDTYLILGNRAAVYHAGQAAAAHAAYTQQVVELWASMKLYETYV